MQEHFGIRIADDEVCSVDTMGDLHALVCRKIIERDALLPWFAAAARARFAPERDAIGLDTPIEALFGGVETKRAWLRLSETLRVPLPDGVAVEVARWAYPRRCAAALALGAILLVVAALAHSAFTALCGFLALAAGVANGVAYARLRRAPHPGAAVRPAAVRELLALVAWPAAEPRASAPPGATRPVRWDDESPEPPAESLRRALAEVSGVPAEDIEPGARLTTILPVGSRHQAWDDLRSATGWDLPRLQRPGTLDLLVAGPTVLVGVLGVVLALCGFADGDAGFVVVGAIVAAIGALEYVAYDQGTARLRVCFPRHIRTVADLMPLVPVRSGMGVSPDSYSPSTPDCPTWLRIRDIVALQTGVSAEAVTPGARWQDLGVD